MTVPSAVKRFSLVLSLWLIAGPVMPAQTAQPESAEELRGLYVLRPADRVRISVFQEEDLFTVAMIDARGQVNLPLVGNIRIAGLTAREAQALLETAYREGLFLRHPQVSVVVEEYALREVSVQGRVAKPGRYVLPIHSQWTVVDLILQAGGLTDTARGTEVRVTRFDEDGKQINFTVDVESIIRGRTRSRSSDRADIFIQEGDVVWVPERLI